MLYCVLGIVLNKYSVNSEMFPIEIVTLYRLMDKVMNKVIQKNGIVDVFFISRMILTARKIRSMDRQNRFS